MCGNPKLAVFQYVSNKADNLSLCWYSTSFLSLFFEWFSVYNGFSLIWRFQMFFLICYDMTGIIWIIIFITFEYQLRSYCKALRKLPRWRNCAASSIQNLVALFSVKNSPNRTAGGCDVTIIPMITVIMETKRWLLYFVTLRLLGDRNSTVKPSWSIFRPIRHKTGNADVTMTHFLAYR